MALACTWGGYADTNVSFAEFFGSDHTLAVRFMLQFPRAYTGPMLSVNGHGIFMVGQADFDRDHPEDSPRLLVMEGLNPLICPTDITAGTWHHLAVVRNGSLIRLYLDAQQVGVMPALLPGLEPKGTLRLGKDTFDPALDGSGKQFYGLLDDAAVFNTALSEAQVKELADSQHLSGSEAGLLAGFVFGYEPPGDLNLKLSRPLTLSYGAWICDVTANRDNNADAAKMPLAATTFMHLPFLPGTQWEVRQGYQGQGDWHSHNGYAAFALDFILAEKGVSEENRIKKTEGQPFCAVAPGKVDSVQNVYGGRDSNFISIQLAPHEFSDYLHFPNYSARFAKGDHVRDGDHVADIGNTGTNPFHLHFSVNNLGEGNKLSGGAFVSIPTPFANYEYSVDEGQTWKHVIRGIPLQGQWVRHAVGTSPIRFSAVWRPSNEGEIQVYDWTLKDFRTEYDKLWPLGWRLKLLAPYVLNDEVIVAAVWRPSTEGEIQVYNWEPKDFRAKYAELWPQGWRLKLLSPYVVRGQVLYAAVWTPSTEDEIQVYDWALADFRAEYHKRWSQGWRLKLLAPYAVGEEVLVSAAWSPSTEGEIHVYDWQCKDFRAKYEELWPQGWRLKLLVPYVVHGLVRYAAAWRPSTAGEIQVYDWEYADFRANYDGLWHYSWRLAQLSPYVLTPWEGNREEQIAQHQQLDWREGKKSFHENGLHYLREHNSNFP